MTLDRLLQDAGAHIDTLIDAHLRATPPLDTLTPVDARADVVVLVDEPEHTAQRPRRRDRWPALAAALVLLAVVVGIAIVQRQIDGPTPADRPPTQLALDGTVNDLHLDTMVFDGTWLWSTRRGSTFLDRRDPATGGVVASFNLPAATSHGSPLVHDGLLYIPTWNGVVEVDTATGAMDGPLAMSEAGEVWSIAVADDAVWLSRRGPDSQTLERWSPDLTALLTDVELSSEWSYAIAASGTSVYVATDERGLQRYGADGRLEATVPGIGASFEMVAGPDGTLWVADLGSGQLVGVDTEHDTVTSRLQVADGSLNSVELTPDGDVWVTAYEEHLLAVVDPSSGTVIASTWLPKPPEIGAYVDGAAWVSGTGGWAMRFAPR